MSTRTKHIIELPWPNRGLFPNRSHGQHWGGLSRLRSEAHDLALTFTLTQIGEWRLAKDRNLELRIRFYAPDHRRRDLDGCYSALKPALDGVAQALGIDDRWFYPVILDWGDVDEYSDGAVVLELRG